jgi:hypothetical protein
MPITQTYGAMVFSGPNAKRTFNRIPIETLISLYLYASIFIPTIPPLPPLPPPPVQ